MCRNELGEFYRWWIFVGVRKLTPTYRASVVKEEVCVARIISRACERS